MLNYQLSLIDPKRLLSADVIYNPNDGEFKKYGPPESKDHIFLYTGGIYQARKADYVLMAFERLLQVHPNSFLYFVGTRLSDQSLALVSTDTRAQIKLFPHTRNLDDFYRKATALIDIDADLENDVFLSSKVINYLMVDRFIISETGTNSPSRKLFNGIPSILQCGHDPTELYNGMGYSIINKNNLCTKDRAEVISKFSIGNITDNFMTHFKKEI